MNTIILYRISKIVDGYKGGVKLQHFVGVRKQAQIWVKSNALELFDADCAQNLYTCLENTLEGERLRGTHLQSREDEYFIVEPIYLKKSELLREIFNGSNDDLEKMYREILRDVGEVAGSQNDIVIHEVMNTLIDSLGKGKYEPIT